jgi:hypothetical protein
MGYHDLANVTQGVAEAKAKAEAAGLVVNNLYLGQSGRWMAQLAGQGRLYSGESPVEAVERALAERLPLR